MHARSAIQASLITIASLAGPPRSSAAPGDVLAPTTLASHTPSGQPGNSVSLNPAISGDGRFVTYWSTASDLLPFDTNNTYDVFLTDTATGAVELVSVSTQGGPADGPSIMPSISADGRYVCFDSGTTNLVSPPPIGYFSTYVRDRQTGTTELVSVSTGGAQANNTTELSGISGDGRYVAFGSYADNLVASHPFTGFRDIYVRDRVTDTTTLVSKGPGGALANSSSYRPVLSGDGRFIAFASQASNLVPGATTPGRVHIFVYDAQSGAISLASADANGVEGNQDSYNPALSADGRYVAFETYATNILPNLVGGKVILRDLTTGAILDVNLDSLGHPIANSTWQPSLSADGRFVAFRSFNVVPNTSGNLFVRDRVLNKTIQACAMDDGNGTTAGTASEAMISADGTTVAIQSAGQLLAGGPANTAGDVYARGIGGPVSYCAAKQNSAGCAPSIAFSGEARVSNNFALTVSCANARNNKIGLLIHSLSGPRQIPFAGGNLCVAAPLVRSHTTLSGGSPPPAIDCSGVWSLDLGAVLATSPIGPAVGAGSVLYMQWWGRDPGFAPPDNVQLSGALQVVVGP